MTDLAPAIILVRPQLGENIGKAARAMLNFGLTDMRLVSPRDGWPNPDAGPAASGADMLLDQAKVFETVEEAIADCRLVFATTVRERGMAKSVATPREAAAQIRHKIQNGERSAYLFGPERSGLANDDVALADQILTVPVNPEFASLNLAQAVIIAAYEFSQTIDATPAYQPAFPEGQASKDSLLGMINHLEVELDKRGYFKSEDRRAHQQRMIRNMVTSASPSEQEVQSWRGIIKSLARPPKET
ncbi:RNA methyltransferase [Temperatibacter marinus]|uniref:RNA methyltransferase n=1 Tax=Temperatibacter marinus TaxID=1456591 RepID=A0AA52EB47_9PROT|nr:RNA methyltransferase [Temperatibacter marinus]WND02087.1 RNA methyltransferase [Temperatibacter marinus]